MMFGFGFGAFEVIFFLMFAAFFVVFILTLFRGAKQWHTNNNSPRLTVDAEVVAKRDETTVHHNSNGHAHHTTSYYVTFEVESGDRIEFSVDGREYGMLVEGDRGKLNFQGTRYLSFARE